MGAAMRSQCRMDTVRTDRVVEQVTKARSRYGMSSFSLFSVLAGGAIVLLVAGLIAKRTFQNRDIVLAYRLTAEVEAGGEHYTGSGVVEVRWRHTSALTRMFAGPTLSPHTRGDAVAVDMGRNGLLFVTLQGGYVASPPDLPDTVFRAGWHYPTDYDAYLRELADQTGVAEIPSNKMPDIVWFTDPTDPRSADCYNWQNPKRPWDSSPQPRFVRATLQMVHEPPTFGIDRLLPWLPAARKAPQDRFNPYRFDVGHNTPAEYCDLHTTDFERGVP